MRLKCKLGIHVWIQNKIITTLNIIDYSEIIKPSHDVKDYEPVIRACKCCGKTQVWVPNYQKWIKHMFNCIDASKCGVWVNN